MRKFLYFICLLFLSHFVIGQTTTLPLLSLTISSTNLAALNANPTSDNLYPAQLTFNNKSYACLVRYRGGTARTLPKKSWKIKFLDNNNPWKVTNMNLSADYRDISYMRNFLTFKLFQFMGEMACDIEHISLNVNGSYYGVYTSVEQVDDDFAQRNSMDMTCLFKASEHGGFRMPFLTQAKIAATWGLKTGYDYREMQELDSKVLFYSNADFEKYIENDINIDNWITYFAIQNTISNNDAYSKNLFTCKNTSTNRFEVIPWDSDATFGNLWSGDYIPSYVTNKGFIMYNYMFWRLMQYPKYRLMLSERVNTVLNEGFTYLNTMIDDTYKRIKNDVYLDTKKKAANTYFDAEMTQLKTYMSGRKSALGDFEMWDKAQFSDISVSNIYPSDAETSITVTLKSNIATTVKMRFYKSKIDSIALYDDGKHNDGKSGDLIYGNTLTVENGFRGAIPLDFFSADPYWCGIDPQKRRFADMQAVRTIYRSNYTLPSATNLQIGNVMKTGNNEYFVEIKNLSSSSVDISYCFLQNKYFENFMFPPNTVIAANTTILISSNPTLSNTLLSGKYSTTIGNLFYSIATNDTLKIIAPDLKPFVSKKVLAFDALPQRSNPTVVINEINYASSSSYYTDDWIELYNPANSTINISGYQIMDKDNRHRFVVPNNTTIAANGYLVITKNLTYFRKYFSVNAIGNLGFGFGSNDIVRVYDTNNQLVDSVAYHDYLPWTPKANSTGATLSLRSPELDNSLAESWTYGLGYGSPAQKNNLPLIIHSQSTYCQGDKVNISTEDGGTIDWYSDSNYSNLLFTGNIYTFEAQTNSTLYISNTSGSNVEKQALSYSVNPLPTVDLDNELSVCANYQKTEGNGLAYEWFYQDQKVTSINESGTYTVKVTDANYCQNTKTVEVSIQDAACVNLGDDITVTATQNVTLKAPAGFDKYLWSNNANTSNITVWASMLSEGIYTYSLTATNSKGCSGSDEIQITVLKSTTEIQNTDNQVFSIYPNPAQNRIFVPEIQNSEIEISTISGCIIYRNSLIYTIIDVSKFARGMYIIKLKTPNQVQTSKLILN